MRAPHGLLITLAAASALAALTGCDGGDPFQAYRDARAFSTGDNSCTYAYDGQCDEGTYCSGGTDSYDCGRSGSGTGSGTGDNSCDFAYDAECDEGTYCDYGTDSYDCDGGSSSGDNSCAYSYDGECDEGTYCSYGTDSYDCG